MTREQKNLLVVLSFTPRPNFRIAGKIQGPALHGAKSLPPPATLGPPAEGGRISVVVSCADHLEAINIAYYRTEKLKSVQKSYTYRLFHMSPESLITH